MSLDALYKSSAWAILDSTPTNILTCDPQTLVIDYANQTSKDTLNRLSHLLPAGVNGDNIVGQNIDVFHKNPQHQRQILSNPANFPYKAIIRLGPEMLDLHVDTLKSGNKIKKLVLSWSICTERERLKIMVDSMPINIMMADPKEFTINYINQTSINTLKTIEHLLPVKAEEVDGICIDRFHKNPEHQRKILSNPANLPYNSKIKLGDEVLELRASAIVDKTGYYLGPMVSWSVITSQENLARSVSDVSSNVSSTSEELQISANELSKAAKDSSSQATAAAAAAEEASVNVQTVAAATEQMSASIGEISRQISESTRFANDAKEKAEATNKVVNELQAAADQISSVVALITDIAEQTNLLALNATIEAARAGEAGKGFAVVASEVKGLAGQTAKATEEIDEQIHTMQAITKSAVEAINSITEAVEKIHESSTVIAAAMEEQNATTEEIARNVSEAATGTSEVSSSVSLVQSSSDKVGQISEQLLNLSSTLSKNSEIMYSQVKEFTGDEENKKPSTASQKTLYEKIGGRAAVNAAVELFYKKLLADNRVNHFFDGVDMKRQMAKQKAFMTYAFGGAPNYSGLSMRKAHERIVKEKGLNESHFNAVAENLVATLKELNVPQNLIDEVISIVASTKNDVLGL